MFLAVKFKQVLPSRIRISWKICKFFLKRCFSLTLVWIFCNGGLMDMAGSFAKVFSKAHHWATTEEACGCFELTLLTTNIPSWVSMSCHLLARGTVQLSCRCCELTLPTTKFPCWVSPAICFLWKQYISKCSVLWYKRLTLPFRYCTSKEAIESAGVVYLWKAFRDRWLYANWMQRMQFPLKCFHQPFPLCRLALDNFLCMTFAGYLCMFMSCRVGSLAPLLSHGSHLVQQKTETLHSVN